MVETENAPPTKAPSERLTRVTGVFHGRRSVVRAVERLSEKSVPADSIRVVVHGPAGERREVPVEDESGALRGAAMGAAFGGVAGLLIVVAATTGLLGPAGVDALSLQGIAGALRAVIGGAAASVPLGALLGMGYWQGRKRISGADFESGSATVVVESDELAELARKTLDAAGASDVSVD